MKKHIPGLDLARGLGTLLVLVAHVFMVLGVLLPYSVSGFTHALVLVANLFMEQFFALSGFLLGGALLRAVEEGRRGVLPSYAVNRMARTWPTYFFMLLVLLFLEAVLAGRYPLVWPYLFFVQNFFSGTEHFFGVTWTLGIEQWSYVLLPLLVLGSARLYPRDGARAVLAAALGLIGLCLLARLTVSCFFEVPYDFGIRKQIPLRLDALMFGLVISWCRTHAANVYQVMADGRSALLVLVVAAGQMLLQQADGLFDYQRILPGNYMWHAGPGLSLTACLAALTLPWLERGPGLQRAMAAVPRIRDVLDWAARYSYSLYLVHLPIYSLLRILYEGSRPVTSLGEWVAAPVLMLFALFMAFSAGVLLHRAVEKPGMKLRYLWKR